MPGLWRCELPCRTISKMAAEIQLALFPSAALTLMRPHRWATKAIGELPLAEIYLEPQGSAWAWGIWFSSRNGAGQGYSAAAMVARNVPTRCMAIARASDEIRKATHRAEPDESERIIQWLGNVLAVGG
jgi:hypothetical protein